MTGMSRRAQWIAAAVPVALLLLTFVVYPREGGSRTVTAHFDRAVAVYPGTHLRVMGVRVGEVTAVVPEGDSVRVEMTYDKEYKLPADAGAAVVTPTLVADRYVQIFPAYSKGPEMRDHADIPLARTKTPIELDRMFKSLDDLAMTLGPKAGSTSGRSGQPAVGERQGSRRQRRARVQDDPQPVAGGRGVRRQPRPAVRQRPFAGATSPTPWPTNDTTVQAFLKELSSVSGQFAGERDELRDVLASLAKVLGSVKGFVHENRATLGKDVKLLSSLLERVDNQKDALGLVVQKGSLAMGNLALAFEPEHRHVRLPRADHSRASSSVPTSSCARPWSAVGTPEVGLHDAHRPAQAVAARATSGPAASVPQPAHDRSRLSRRPPRTRLRPARPASCPPSSTCSGVVRS